MLVTVLSVGGMSQPLLADIQTAEMNKSSADPTIKKIIAETISLLEKDLANLKKQKQKQALKIDDKEVKAKIYKLDIAISTVTSHLSILKVEILPLVEKKDHTNAKSHISRISANYGGNGYVTTGLTDKLSLTVKMIDDLEEAQVNQVQDEVHQFHKGLGKTLLNVQQIGEIDSMLVSLAALKDKCVNKNGSNSAYYKISNQINQTTTIVSSWQDYLSSIANKDANGARSHLRNVLRDVAKNPIIPRSEILKAIANVEQNIAKLSATVNGKTANMEPIPEILSLETILSRYTKADDLVKVITETTNIRTHGPSSKHSSAFTLLQQAQFLHNAHQLALKGQSAMLVTTLGAQPTTSTHREWREVILLEIKMLSFANMIPTEHQAEMHGKSPIQQTEFLAGKLHKEKKWTELWELLSFSKQLINSRSNSYATSKLSWFENDLYSLSSFLAAQRYEEAGELAKALLRYREVLAKNGRYSPYIDAQKAIKNIRENKSEALIKNELEEAALLKASPTNMSRYPMRSHRIDDSQINNAVEKAVSNRMAL